METQTVLIVDDSPLNIQIMKDILGDDYHILCATSGKQALTVAESENVDLILLDVVMPVMDGYEVCRKIKANPHTKGITVIFVSSMEQEADQTKGLEAGAIDYIIKPVSPPIVRIRVKNHLELKKYRDLLERLSLIDDLTGISNRRDFDQVLENSWQRRKGSPLSLLMLDLDYYKKFNDYYGHLAGDDCLRQVGKVLKDSVDKPGSLVARYGGEEFAVLMPATSPKEASRTAETLRRNVEKLEIIHPASPVGKFVTVSVGVATAEPQQDLGPNELIRYADRALYQAKNSGRNKVIAIDANLQF